MCAKRLLLCAGLTASISVTLLALFGGITTRDQLLVSWIVVFFVGFVVIKLSSSANSGSKNKGDQR